MNFKINLIGIQYQIEKILNYGWFWIIDYIITIHYNVHLKSIYPNYEWIPWKFHQTPKNYWLNIENQRKYCDWLSNQLNIKSMEDWYKL